MTSVVLFNATLSSEMCVQLLFYTALVDYNAIDIEPYVFPFFSYRTMIQQNPN